MEEVGELMIQLSDYVSGGYFITRPAKRLDWQYNFLPNSLLSFSRHICKYVPDAWAIEWTGEGPDSRLKTASSFDLTTEAIKEITEWSTENFDKEFGAWYVIFRLETAQCLRERFLGHLNDVVILGAGLHRSLCDGFLEKTKAPLSEPGFAPSGEGGDYLAVSQKIELLKGGIPLGFEPVSRGFVAYECSWFCNKLEKEARKRNIPLNDFGLFGEFTDALKFTELINEGKIDAEPCPWWPWLLVDYSRV